MEIIKSIEPIKPIESTEQEFNIIKKYFQWSIDDHPDLLWNDDCAIIPPNWLQSGEKLVISTDLLIEGIHFFHDVCPIKLGHKALAVNLSDIAAMTARPVGFFLSIGLPHHLASSDDWLKSFAQGMKALSLEYSCPLLGGDTTKSEQLVINITILGASRYPIRKNNINHINHIFADTHEIWVSRSLGSARLALDYLYQLKNKTEVTNIPTIEQMKALEQPIPEIEKGLASQGLWELLTDVSDGLLHELQRFKFTKQTVIDVNLIPREHNVSLQQALLGGDDYALCGVAHVKHHDLLKVQGWFCIGQTMTIPSHEHITNTDKIVIKQTKSTSQLFFKQTDHRIISFDELCDELNLKQQLFSHFS
jgi:thiamine-monophosphate kinase